MRAIGRSCWLGVWLAACAQGGAISDDDATALPCVPFEMRACPCNGGGSGRQTCARSGLSFGVCHGCPDGAAVQNGSLSAPAPRDHATPAPGSLCGVGLPVQCAVGREKCCVRSLSTDTCIADDAACTCDLDECDVVEVHCDGPEDCAQGDVCCGTLKVEDSGFAHYTAFACAMQCAPDQNLACHADGASCPGGLVCADSQLIANVQICTDSASLER